MRRLLLSACVLVLVGAPSPWAQERGETDGLAHRAVDLLRQADLPGFRRFVEAHPEVIDMRAAGGATLAMFAALYGDADTMAWLLQRGADPNARDDARATALMWAVDDAEIGRVLVSAGADLNARSALGRTPLSIAAAQPAAVAMARLLVERGADREPAPASRGRCLRVAATAVGEVETGGLSQWRDRLLQGMAPGDGPATVADMLLALHARQHARDLFTDAMVRYLRNTQLVDGRWTAAAGAATCRSDIVHTTLALRAMQLYSPPQFESFAERSLARAVWWLIRAKPGGNEDHAFRLLGLVWGGAAKHNVAAASRRLLEAQRADGAWAQGAETVATTRLALAALLEAGLAPEEPPYKKATHFLSGSDHTAMLPVRLMASLQSGGDRR